MKSRRMASFFGGGFVVCYKQNKRGCSEFTLNPNLYQMHLCSVSQERREFSSILVGASLVRHSSADPEPDGENMRDFCVCQMVEPNAAIQ